MLDVKAFAFIDRILIGEWGILTNIHRKDTFFKLLLYLARETNVVEKKIACFEWDDLHVHLMMGVFHKILSNGRGEKMSRVVCLEWLRSSFVSYIQKQAHNEKKLFKMDFHIFFKLV